MEHFGTRHFLGWSACALALAGCATSPEATAWNLARQVNTPRAYEDYVQRYPNSSNAAEASRLVERSQWEAVQKKDTVQGYQDYLRRHPETEHKREVESRTLAAAKRTESPGELQAFLAAAPDPREAAALQARLEELSFGEAKKAEEPAPLDLFLLKYPSSRFADEARELLGERLYKQARDWDSPFGYGAFLARFPKHRKAGDARAKAYSPGEAPASDVETLLEKAAEADSELKHKLCALDIARRIREAGAGAQAQQLRGELDRAWPKDGPLPEGCPRWERLASGVKARGALASALAEATKVARERDDLAKKWNIFKQRQDMVKGSLQAATQLQKDLESDELATEVLGGGSDALGGLNLELSEKGSATARKAMDRLAPLEPRADRNLKAVEELLREVDGHFQASRSYVVSLLLPE